MGNNNHVYDVKNHTNYKIIIKTCKLNKIKLSVMENPSYSAVDINNTELFEINYYNGNSDKIIITCVYDNPDYNIEITEENIIVKQVYMNKILQNTFLDDMKQQYQLREYDNDYEPAIFYGLMNDDDVSALEKNKSLKIIIWVGGDINFSINRDKKTSLMVRKKVERILKISNIRHISISSFITRSLQLLQVPFKIVPFMGINFDAYKPVIKGPCIYLYTALCSENYYGLRFYKRLMDKYKGVQFIVTCCLYYYQYLLKNPNKMKYGIKYYTKEQLINEVYPQCFIGLRLTDHDGLSATVQELGLMGIKSIHNGCSPSALNYETYEDICAHIDREMKLIGTCNEELPNKVRNYLSIDSKFFETDFHKNNA